jgi:hypothetical protein
MNQIAASLVAAHTGQSLPAINLQPAKNPAAVALGRLGGLKGGNARAESLSAKRKKEIAKKAAAQKWKKYYSKHPK